MEAQRPDRDGKQPKASVHVPSVRILAERKNQHDAPLVVGEPCRDDLKGVFKYILQLLPNAITPFMT